MFSVAVYYQTSALLVDAAAGRRAVTHCKEQHSCDISQGSVATHLSCDGIFSNSVITNFLLILTVK